MEIVTAEDVTRQEVDHFLFYLPFHLHLFQEGLEIIVIESDEVIVIDDVEDEVITIDGEDEVIVISHLIPSLQTIFRGRMR